MLREGTEYRELGGTYFDGLHAEQTQKRLIARLERLGLEVSVKARAGAANALAATAHKGSI